MPSQPLTLQQFLASIILGTLAAIFAAYLWLFRQLRDGKPLLPIAKPPRPVPWGLGTILAVLLSLFLSGSLLKTTYSALRKPAPPSATAPIVPPASPVKIPLFTLTEQIGLLSVLNLLLLVALPVLVYLLSGASRSDLGLTGEHLLRNIQIGTVAFLLITPLLILTNAFAQLLWALLVKAPVPHPLFEMLRNEGNTQTYVLAYLSAGILAPAVEELIFRGIIQAWLARFFAEKPTPAIADLADLESFTNVRQPRWTPRFPRWLPLPPLGPNFRRSLPILLTSTFFALVHFPQMPAPFAIFFLSLLLGLLFQRTNSLVPSFVLHGLFNSLNTTLLLFALTALPAPAPPVKNPPKNTEKSVKVSAFPLTTVTWAGNFPVSMPLQVVVGGEGVATIGDRDLSEPLLSEGESPAKSIQPAWCFHR